MVFISQPWPWYVSGPCIVVVMFLLLYFGGTFGMSSNLRTLCAIGGAGKKVPFFNFDWQSQKWNLAVVLGAMVGGNIGYFYLSVPTHITTNLNPKTVSELESMGFSNVGKSLLPQELFSWDAVFSLKGILILITAGFLIGFGTRYGGGCTSGHAITGLSSLQLPSLIAVIGFFLGGLVMVHLIYPILF